MAITTLPYPNMDFVPLDVLTADELDQIVANIEAINSASIATGAIANNAITTAKIADGNITTAKVADDAITSAKIDWTTITETDYSSQFTWASGISTASNDRLINIRVKAGVLYIELRSCCNTSNAVPNSWTNVGTLPASAIPSNFPSIGSIEFAGIICNRDNGQPNGYGKIRLNSSGLLQMRGNSSASNSQMQGATFSWPLS